MLLLSPFTKYVTFGSPNIFSTNFDFSIIFLDNFLWTKYKLKMVWLCHMHFLNLSCIMDRKLLGVYLRFRDRVLNNLLFRRSERSSRRYSWVMFGSTQYHIRETVVVYGDDERILPILTLVGFGRTPAKCQPANRSPRLSLRIGKVSYHIDGIKRDQ